MTLPDIQSTVLLRSEDTDGAVSVVDNVLPGGFAGPPLHEHGFDEAFLVLDGELTFQVHDELLSAGPDALAFAPRGVAHTLANRGAAPARYLLVCTPAGFERYFGRIAAQRAGVEPPAWALAPTPPVETVGPQIGAGDARPIAPAEREAGPQVLLRSEETDGAVSVVLTAPPAGAAGPFLHEHDFDEAFCVLDGELAFQVGDELTTVRAGEVAFAPRGVPHAFANRGAAPARMAIVCTPAGFEREFARRAARMAGVEPPDWARQPIPEVRRVGPRIGEDG